MKKIISLLVFIMFLMPLTVSAKESSDDGYRNWGQQNSAARHHENLKKRIENIEKQIERLQELKKQIEEKLDEIKKDDDEKMEEDMMEKDEFIPFEGEGDDMRMPPPPRMEDEDEYEYEEKMMPEEEDFMPPRPPRDRMMPPRVEDKEEMTREEKTIDLYGRVARPMRGYNRITQIQKPTEDKNETLGENEESVPTWFQKRSQLFERKTKNLNRKVNRYGRVLNFLGPQR